jgi:beta-glucanase (GH16 family)
MTPPSLLWSDEFDAPAGSPPDPETWAFETGDGGWGNGELQAYTAGPENAFHDGRGCLVIRAIREGGRYTSARISSKRRFEFGHGRLECRAVLPRGAGLWSAIWSLGASIDTIPWPACGEIDIVENVGHEPDRIFGTVHCPGRSGKNGVSGAVRSAEPLHAGFHIFAIDRRPGRISWSLDGVPYFSVTREDLGAVWVFEDPFYVLINLAVGGWLGGDVAPETAFPADLRIDYLRLFDIAAGGGE